MYEIEVSFPLYRKYHNNKSFFKVLNDQEFEDIAPYVTDSGEGRWTVKEAIDLNVAAPVITESLLRRIRSRETDSYTDKLVNVTRNQFSGHTIAKKDE